MLQVLLPLDLRVKKTRAIRRRLTKEQVGLRCTGTWLSVINCHVDSHWEL